MKCQVAFYVWVIKNTVEIEISHQFLIVTHPQGFNKHGILGLIETIF